MVINFSDSGKTLKEQGLTDSILDIKFSTVDNQLKGPVTILVPVSSPNKSEKVLPNEYPISNNESNLSETVAVRKRKAGTISIKRQK